MQKKQAITVLIILLLASFNTSIVLGEKNSKSSCYEVIGVLGPVLSYAPEGHDFGDLYEGEIRIFTFHIFHHTRQSIHMPNLDKHRNTLVRHIIIDPARELEHPEELKLAGALDPDKPAVVLALLLVAFLSLYIPPSSLFFFSIAFFLELIKRT